MLQVSNITNIALAFGFSIFVLVYATAAYTGEASSILLIFLTQLKPAHSCLAKSYGLRS